MTLEDFFTLTERNNGLISPSRVKELLTVMQSEKDFHVDSARHWSAVASAIAATDNKDCLDLFIQLDGLHFFDKWLTDAQKLSNNTNTTFLSDSISNLLRAIQKLPVEFENLVASGIWTTLEDLLVSNSSKIQENARELYQKWKMETDGKNIVASSDNKVQIAEDNEKGNIHFEGEESVLVKGQESTSHDPVQNMPEISEPLNGGECPLDHVISNSSDKPTTIDSRCQDAVDAVGDSHQLESPHDTKNSPKNENSTEKENSLEKSKTSLEKPVDSCSDATDAVKSEYEANSQIFSSNVDEISLCNDILRATDLEGKQAMDVNGFLNQSRSSKAYKHPILRKPFSSVKSLKTPNKHLLMVDGDLANKYDFAENKMDIRSHQCVKKSDIELDYATFDPLEVARQVAIEVEREVIDYKEQNCSSSSDKPDSPDNVKQSSNSESGSVKDTIDGPDSSASSPTNEDSSTSTESLDAEQRNVSPEMESSQVREPAQVQVKPVKEVGNFDLNEEICFDDNDHSPNQFPTPVAVVSASKAKAAPEQPAAPLQFEGNLGWKGSAATSAFRPASPRRNPESEKGRFLDFDLNIAESVDGESSFAASSRKYELDLNHASEDGPSSLNFDLNGQPSFLNDSLDCFHLNKSSQNHVSGGIQSDDSVISIMGKRVQVNRKDSFSQTQPLLIGHTAELAFDLNLGRSGNFLGIGSVVPYTHSSVYGYNNIGPGPGLGSNMPFSSPVYGGPIPYMVDSRRAPLMPQIIGPVSSLPTSFTQPPFVVNMTDPSPSNVFMPSHSNFDMTSGLMVGNGSGSGSGNGEPVGFRQFLSSGQLRTTMDEQMMPNAQSNMVSVVGKRKEPENGWENYPFRHYMN